MEGTLVEGRRSIFSECVSREIARIMLFRKQKTAQNTNKAHSLNETSKIRFKRKTERTAAVRFRCTFS